MSDTSSQSTENGRAASQETPSAKPDNANSPDWRQLVPPMPEHPFRRQRPAFPRFSIFKLLVSLFISPRLALLNVRIHRLWGRTLVILLGTAVIAGLVKTYETIPEMQEDCRDVAKLCADAFGALTCAVEPAVDGKPQTCSYSWSNQELQLPYSAASGEWRLDVVDTMAQLDHGAIVNAQEPIGIVVAHDALTFWYRVTTETGTAVRYADTLSTNLLADVFRQYGQPRENAFELTGDEMMSIGEIIGVGIAGVFGLQQTLDGIQMTFICLLLFIVMSFMFQRGLRVPLTAHIASAFACVIPPFLLANIGALIPAIALRLDTLFTVFFLIYLVVIYLDRSVVIAKQSRE